MVDLAYVLHDLVLHLDRAAEERLAPWGLTLRRFVALTVIAEYPKITSRRLSGILAVSEPSTGQLVRGLLDAAMVSDTSSPGSGRAKAWEVTPTGQQVLDSARSVLAGQFHAAVTRSGEDPEDLARRLNVVLHELTHSEQTPS